MGPEKARRHEGRQDVTTPEEATPGAPGDDTEGTPEVTPEAEGGDTDVTLNHQEPSSEPSGTALAERIQDQIPAPEAALFPAAAAGTHADLEAGTVRADGWDALVNLFGYEPHSPAEQKLWTEIAGRADTEPDPADAVHRRARALVGQWGLAKLTPPSLNKWWDRFDSLIGTATDADEAELREQYERDRRREKAAEMERA